MKIEPIKMEPKVLEISQKMEDVKLSAGDSQEKLEKVHEFAVKMSDDDAIEKNNPEAGEKFQLEAGEKIPTVDSAEKMKRNSLTKFFRLKSKSSKTDLNKAFADEAIKPASKIASLTRVFSKKPKDTEKGADKPEVKSRRTFSMRDMVNIPWVRSKTSQMNLQKPIDFAAREDDEATPAEVLTESVII